MKRKVKITVETEEITSFKTRKSLTSFCERCGKTVEIFTMESVASFLGLSEYQIFRLIEAGSVHLIEAERVYICRNSLEIKLLKENLK